MPTSQTADQPAADIDDIRDWWAECMTDPDDESADDGEGDNNGRAARFEGEHLLHLDAGEWDVIDGLLANSVPLRGIGSRCAHTPHPLPAWVVADGRLPGIWCRPSPVLGGTFILFPGE
jgi:hypothetical protein